MINRNKWLSKRSFIYVFFPSYSNQTHTLQKIPQTIWICGHFQNKQFKTTSSILSELTIPGEHHTTGKGHQNRKRIKMTFLHSENSFLIIFSYPFSLPLPPRHHFIYKVLRHQFIVNIFRRNKICWNPFPLHLSLFLSHQQTNIISTFTTRRIFNETWYIWL